MSVEPGTSNAEIADRQRYRWMVEAAGDVIYTTDPSGHFTYVNPRIRNLLGYQPEEIMGKHFTHCVAPEWRERVEAFYRQQVRDLVGETNLEFPALSKEGVEVWVEQIVTLVREGETITGFQASARDISARKLAEQTLQKNEQRYRALFEQTNDAVFILDLNGVQIAANRQAGDLLGYELNNLVGVPFSDVISSTEQAKASNVLQMVRSGQMVPVYGCVFRRRNGVEFPAEVNIGLAHDSDGEPSFILSVVRDVTERKRAEEIIRQNELNLRRNKERVEAILNGSSDAIILTYPDGTLQQANPAFSGMFGYELDDLFGKPLAVLVEESSAEALTRGVTDVMEANQARRIEVVARRQDGTTFAADVVLSPIASEGGKQPAGIICSLRDMTRHEQMEEDLRQSLEKEKELSELKTRFVSMASHEFRTPLATIQASCDMIRNYLHKMTPEQISARFDKIQAQVKHMAIMLDDVLTLGRLQDGRIEFNPAEIAVDQFSREIVEEMRGLHGTTHQFDYVSSAQDRRARLDKKLARQIITNLLTNAVKYSPQGSAVRFEVSEEEGWLILRVTDAGIGIPEEDQKHLFEPFHRAKNVGEVSGTGLGLAITKQGVELHGGTITCQSAVGAGTTFTVSIPIVLSEEGSE